MMFANVRSLICLGLFASTMSCVVGDDLAVDDGVDSTEEDLQEDAIDIARGIDQTPEAQTLEAGVDTLAAQVNAAIQYDDQERQMLVSINAYRDSHGLKPCRVSIARSTHALEVSQDMADALGQANPASEEPQFWTTGSTAAAVFQEMTQGLAGRELLTDPALKRVGIARAKGTDGKWYWTVSFGSAMDAILSLGVTSIANNNNFEAPSATGLKAVGDVRTLGKWFFDGATMNVGVGPDVKYKGIAGLRVADITKGKVATATQLVRGAAGVHYRLSIFTKPFDTSTGTQNARLQFLDASFHRLGGATVNTSYVAEGSGSAGVTLNWHKIETSAAVSPAGTRFVRIVIGDTATGTQTGIYGYDNMRLEAY